MSAAAAERCADDMRKPVPAVRLASKWDAAPSPSHCTPIPVTSLIQVVYDRLRRVKCDEGRPSCQRCTTSGRECRGYQPAPVGNFSWQQLLQLRQPGQAVDLGEARSLSYYHEVVAPSLARSLKDAFWVMHVPQVLDQEPAARHAVLAISALYEEFDVTLLNAAAGPLDSRTAHTSRLEPSTDISSGYAFALQHYNNAIRMVLDDRIDTVESLLTVSLLFTCIELLQGSADAAAGHCQHGVRVHSRCRLPSELSAGFNDLKLFDTLTGPQATFQLGEPVSIAFSDMDTLIQARQALDECMARGARLLPLAAEYRMGSTLHDSHDLKTEQFQIHRAMNLWRKGYIELKRRLLSTSLAEADTALLRLLETRWLVTSILLNSGLADNENELDEYMDQFRRIVELAEQEKVARSASGLRLPSFSFNMGYLPLLYIVITKCRHLQLRVRALVLLQDLSCARETIWDARILYATAMWVIEFEHDLTLDEERMRSTTNPYPEELLSSDAKRIIGFNNSDEASLAVDSAGRPVVRRRICFHTSGPDGVDGPLWSYTTTRL